MSNLKGKMSPFIRERRTPETKPISNFEGSMSPFIWERHAPETKPISNFEGRNLAFYPGEARSRNEANFKL